MSLDKVNSIFDVASRAMSAQMTRLNTIASNLANANTVASSSAEAYKALRPVFAAQFSEKVNSSVGVESIVALDREPGKTYAPDHPKSDDQGYIYRAAVDTDEEMVEMLEASRHYQNNLEVLSTLRSLMMRTISMGR
jgi:flagellar basal-body rod protein FlgC